MEAKILQIESIGAEELLTRLERIENAVLNGSQQLKVITPNPQTDLLTRREVAKMLHISLVTINDWVKKGVLKAYKAGNRVYFKSSEIESALIQKGGIYATR